MAAVNSTTLLQRSPNVNRPYYKGHLRVGDISADSGDILATRSLKLTLTSTQLLALETTPVTLLAAPGAGFFIQLETVIVTKPAGTAYASVGAGDDISIRETDGSGTQLAGIETTGFLDQTTAQTRVVHGYRAASGVSDVTRLDNALICLFLGGAITTGNSPLHFIVYYKVLPSSIS
jgi:hypothetical protein